MDEKLRSNLRKAPKLSARALHPGNKKQSVPLVLVIQLSLNISPNVMAHLTFKSYKCLAGYL